MPNQREDASSEAVRRILATESAARRAEQEARAEAESRLEKARGDARAIEARAVERIRRIHERARRADALECEALRERGRQRLERLESEFADEATMEQAVARVSAWLTGADGGGPGRRGDE